MTGDPWTEDDLVGLGPDEYDYQEFKGSAWLDLAGAINPEFTQYLSKQLSAFANGGGGRIVIGVDDEGRVDGGARTDLKSGGTRSWLEDICPGLVDPPLATFNVHEVVAEREGSRIGLGRAVYVIELPASDAAPHQALDHRYYLRIAGKSRPMGHVHLQDVLRRTQHPRVFVRRVAPYGAEERVTTDPRGPKALIALRMYLRNHGKRLAHHVGAEVVLPRALVNQDVRRRTLEAPDLSLTQRPGTIAFFRYHPNPMFPGQDLEFLQFWVGLHHGNLESVAAGATVAWKVYADDAPAREGHKALADFAVVRSAMEWLRRELAQIPLPTPTRPR